MKAKENKDTKSGVGFKDSRYTGFSRTGETQM